MQRANSGARKAPHSFSARTARQAPRHVPRAWLQSGPACCVAVARCVVALLQGCRRTRAPPAPRVPVCSRASRARPGWQANLLRAAPCRAGHRRRLSSVPTERGIQRNHVLAWQRQCVRAVKEMDSQSIGLCPQGFESPRCRLTMERCHSAPRQKLLAGQMHAERAWSRGLRAWPGCATWRPGCRPGRKRRQS